MLFGRESLWLCLIILVWLIVAVHGLQNQICPSSTLPEKATQTSGATCPDGCDECNSTTLKEQPRPGQTSQYLDQLRCNHLPDQTIQCCRKTNAAPSWWAPLQTLHSASALQVSSQIPLQPRLNVLMFIVDDMRPDLKVYGHKDAPPTPHLDAFAASARVFRRAYSQVFTLVVFNI